MVVYVRFLSKSEGKVYEIVGVQEPQYQPGSVAVEWAAVAKRAGAEFPNLAALIASQLALTPQPLPPKPISPKLTLPPPKSKSGEETLPPGDAVAGYGGQQSQFHPQPQLQTPPVYHPQPHVPGGAYGGQQVWPQPQQATVQSENILQQFLAAQQQQHLPSPLATHQQHPLPGTHQPHPSPGTQQLQPGQPQLHLSTPVSPPVSNQGSGLSTLAALLQFQQYFDSQRIVNRFAGGGL